MTPGKDPSFSRDQNQWTPKQIQGSRKSCRLPIPAPPPPPRGVGFSNLGYTRECIPRNTNCLKPVNAHCNAETPRCNSFWGPLTRLGEMFDRSVRFFGTSIRNNFNTTTPLGLNLKQVIGETEMSGQRSQYQTKHDEKLCNHDMAAYKGSRKSCRLPIPGPPPRRGF
jgi:hypothetical protein